MSTFWIEFFNWQSNSRTVDLFSSHCTLILITTIYNRITLFTLRSTNPPITYVLVGSIVSSAVWPSGDKYTSEEGSNTDSLNKSHFHQSLTKVPYEKLQANSLHQHIEEIHYSLESGFKEILSKNKKKDINPQTCKEMGWIAFLFALWQKQSCLIRLCLSYGESSHSR